MPHIFRCSGCNHSFVAPHDYDDDPKTRKCLSCGQVEGIMYEGNHGSASYVISDSMGGVNGIQSMADGKHYDSKSDYRKELKRQGYIELGSDAPREGRKEIRGDYATGHDIKQAIEQVRARS